MIFSVITSETNDTLESTKSSVTDFSDGVDARKFFVETTNKLIEEALSNRLLDVSIAFKGEKFVMRVEGTHYVVTIIERN